MSKSGFECKSVCTWLRMALSEQRFAEDSSVGRALLKRLWCLSPSLQQECHLTGKAMNADS